MTVLVTGATGTVGRDVARGLAEAGEAVRCATTSHGHRGSPDLPGESVAFDFTDPSTYGPALAGVDRIFLVRPPAISNVARDIRPFVLAAARRPIRLVVFLSLMGVNRVMPHWRIEQDLGAAGLPATMLRPAFFTQNLATAYRADIAEHDRIRLPAGSGRTSFVDTLDVARAAVVALRDPARCVGLGLHPDRAARVDLRRGGVVAVRRAGPTDPLRAGRVPPLPRRAACAGTTRRLRPRPVVDQRDRPGRVGRPRHRLLPRADRPAGDRIARDRPPPAGGLAVIVVNARPRRTRSAWTCGDGDHLRRAGMVPGVGSLLSADRRVPPQRAGA